MIMKVVLYRILDIFYIFEFLIRSLGKGVYGLVGGLPLLSSAMHQRHPVMALGVTLALAQTQNLPKRGRPLPFPRYAWTEISNLR